MSDDLIREKMDEVPVPDLGDPPLAVAPPLAQATVALVTTAGLHHRDDPGWRPDAAAHSSWDAPTSAFWRADGSFRVLDAARRDLELAHWSPNFDRAGFAADLNVVFPIDRLAELHAAGEIGRVAPRHLAFVGAQDATMSTIRLDSGPAAAELLLADGVDVVMLLPVCPVCSRTVGTLSHVLESHGLATVGLSLVRGQTERLRPPRSLFVRFPFGRPLGRPADPEFQRRVLRTALQLLDVAHVPVLEDFDTSVSDVGEGLTCTMPPAFDPSLPPAVDEALALRPAYERQLARAAGRTSVGRAVDVDGVPDAIGLLMRVEEGDDVDAVGLPGPITDVALDIRSFYEESALALVDHVPAAREAENWFFRETETGRLLLRLRGRLRSAGAERDTWNYLAPMTQPDPDA